MRISEIEKVIASKTIKDYEKFGKALISLRDISFVINHEGKQIPSFVLQSTYYDIDSNILNKETKLNHLIYYNVKELVEEISKERKINKGTLTIYPNGEYESSFIWDEQAYLGDLLQDVKGFFNLIHQEIESCDIFFDEEGSSIAWEDIMVIISFKSGKVEPLSIEIKSGENIIYHTEPIGDEYGEYRYQVSKQRYEDIYHLTNEGELKEKLSPKWNVATIHIKNGALRYNFDFDRDVSFEWREENA